MSDDFKTASRLDIKGQICPYTFVRSKLAVEKMNLGEIIEIITDHKQAREDIPRNFANEGQQVIRIDQTAEEEWHIFVRKTTQKPGQKQKNTDAR